MLELDDVAEVIADAVREATEPLAKQIAALEERKDAIGVTSALIDRDGNLILTMSDGSTKGLGAVVGSDGAPGENGKHGLSAEDVDATILEDGRTVEFSVSQGDTTYIFELAFPVPMYRGVYADGESYEKGDMVTWGGSVWHCQADTTEKPGTDDWQLAVKKGRDARTPAT